MKCGATMKGNFCMRCGTKISPTIETAKQSLEKVTKELEITDNFKRHYVIVIVPLMSFLVGFLGFLSISVILYAGDAPTPSGASIMWTIFLIFLLPLILLCIFALVYNYKFLVPERRFYVSNVKIEIFVPKKPPFEIYWFQFDTLKIKRKWVYRGPDNYVLHFLRGSVELSKYRIRGNSFHGKKLTEIRYILQEIAEEKNITHVFK